MSSFEYQINGVDRLIAKMQSASKEAVVFKSMDTSAILLSGWVKKNRLTGPRPKFLGVRTNRLRSSISASRTQKDGNIYITRIGTNVVYGPIHEYGGYAGRNRKVFIPKRPFLAPALKDPQNQKDIITIFTKNINEALNK